MNSERMYEKMGKLLNKGKEKSRKIITNSSQSYQRNYNTIAQIITNIIINHKKW